VRPSGRASRKSRSRVLKDDDDDADDADVGASQASSSQQFCFDSLIPPSPAGH
jgi:hypothetical protein